jgi:hypothetical protein
VAYHYIGGMRDQLFLLPVSMRDWLAEGHLAWFVIEVVLGGSTPPRCTPGIPTTGRAGPPTTRT